MSFQTELVKDIGVVTGITITSLAKLFVQLHYARTGNEEEALRNGISEAMIVTGLSLLFIGGLIALLSN